MSEQDIKQYIGATFGRSTIYYFPNPGNAGDSLIACATFNLFKKMGVRYKIINKWEWRTFDPKGKILVYAGGGNLMARYNDAREFIERFHEQALKLVVLPHTVSEHADLLKTLSNNVDIICRESVSYGYVKKMARNANVYLMEDVAFMLNIKDILSAIPSKPDGLVKAAAKKIYFMAANDGRRFGVVSPKLLMRYKLLELENVLTHKTSDGVLNCFRKDVESTSIDIPPGNVDVSEAFAFGTHTELLASYAAYKLLKFMSQYKEIRTNRLHACIAGLLLGKRVDFYPNNYFKCEAVYRQSIEGRYENVVWND